MNILKHPRLKEFCDRIKKYNFNTKAKLCGLDLKDETETFKLYVELTEIPKVKVIEEFLGKIGAEKFLFYSKYWEPARSSGLAFGIKIDNNGGVRNYFHIKFKDNYHDVLHRENLSFLGLLRISLSSLKKGISYEIETEDDYYNKFYVYIHNKEDIKKVLEFKHKDLPANIDEIEELEIYATACKYKINIVNKMYEFNVHQDVWNIIPKNHLERVKEYSTALQAEPVYTGYTKDNICSIYFSLTNKPNNILQL